LITGWGVVELARGALHHLDHGAIESAANQGQAVRLRRIYQGLEDVLRRYEPQAMSVEKVFFAHNAQSALKLGQARGVVLLAAAENGIPVHEYAATEIKMAVVGYGRAGKEQVLGMVSSLLQISSHLSKDAADALAAAICHLHQHLFQARIRTDIAGREAKRWKVP
jgi:crossover junction endodeoxyribonuclease RuvC